MRTERPSCLILCFDWRQVYDTGPCCCECCISSAGPRADASARQPCCSEAHVCCTRDGCVRHLEEQRKDVASPGRVAAVHTAARTEHPRPAQSSFAGSGSPPSVPPVLGHKTSGSHVEPRIAMPGDEVASAEAEAMATIEFFRERLQRRLVVPKIVRGASSEWQSPVLG